MVATWISNTVAIFRGGYWIKTLYSATKLEAVKILLSTSDVISADCKITH